MDWKEKWNKSWQSMWANLRQRMWLWEKKKKKRKAHVVSNHQKWVTHCKDFLCSCHISNDPNVKTYLVAKLWTHSKLITFIWNMNWMWIVSSLCVVRNSIKIPEYNSRWEHTVSHWNTLSKRVSEWVSEEEIFQKLLTIALWNSAWLDFQMVDNRYSSIWMMMMMMILYACVPMYILYTLRVCLCVCLCEFIKLCCEFQRNLKCSFSNKNHRKYIYSIPQTLYCLKEASKSYHTM